MNPKKIGCFRILVIGRASAGNTTVFSRVCNTPENPTIYSAGKKRGEMVFKSNPGFIFHDSRGGGGSEFEKVKAFIEGRSEKMKIENQLHAIWYCIPMDEASRSSTQCDTGSSKLSHPVAVEIQLMRRIVTVLSSIISKDIRHSPKCHVCLPNMDKDDADCGPLIERTAGTLDDEVLKQLFVSTQQTNLELCAPENTFNYTETTSSKDPKEIKGRWAPGSHIFEQDYRNV
ncbi:hypothetical protein BDR06DRAFT_976747 [Suillus hirtellus]|nr:hypothetical protein BDR06DRAFT_976747 [Suillus hirtellus]